MCYILCRHCHNNDCFYEQIFLSEPFSWIFHYDKIIDQYYFYQKNYTEYNTNKYNKNVTDSAPRFPWQRHVA